MPEYTPELDEQMLERLYAKMRGEADIQRGRARGEAIGRGLGGDVYEASAVGAVDQGLAGRMADATADFGYRRAGLQREERLIGEGRKYGTSEREASQAYSSAENEKMRMFQERMARLGYQNENDQYNSRYNDRLLEMGIGALAGGFGNYMGRR